MRRPALLLTLVLVALPAAACGESDKDKYIDDYKPLNDQLLDVGQDLSKAIQGADTQSDAQLAATFEGLAKELEGVRDDIADLDTPDDLKEESEALTKRIDSAVGGIEDISKAAQRERCPGRRGGHGRTGGRCGAGQPGAERFGEGHGRRRRPALTEPRVHSCRSGAAWSRLTPSATARRSSGAAR